MKSQKKRIVLNSKSESGITKKYTQQRININFEIY